MNKEGSLSIQARGKKN